MYGYGSIFEIHVRNNNWYGLIFEIDVRKRNWYGSISECMCGKRNWYGLISKCVYGYGIRTRLRIPESGLYTKIRKSQITNYFYEVYTKKSENRLL